MEYSKIKEINIKNFNRLGDVKLVFDEQTPIISLRGKNGVGKTSVIKAIKTLGLNTGNLKEYVKHGENEFVISTRLEDNTFIKRSKGKKNCCQVINPDGSIALDIDKIDKGFKIEEVDKRMGFWQEEETGEAIQARAVEEPLLFTETKASDNYKIFYNALKVEDLLKGLKYGSSDCNDIKKKINEAMGKKKGLLELKEKIKVIDEDVVEQLTDIRDALEKDEKYETIIKQIKQLQKEKKQMKKEVIDLPKVSDIVFKVGNLIKLKKLSAISDIPKAYGADEILKLYKEMQQLKVEKEKINKELSETKLVCPHCGQAICDC